VDLWEKNLDALAKDEKMSVRVPEITRRSGRSERSALRILDLARKGVIDPSQFSIMTITVQDMTENVFLQWLEFLLSICHPYSPSILLNLFYSRYIHDHHSHSLSVQPSEDIIFRVLNNYLEPQKNLTSLPEIELEVDQKYPGFSKYGLLPESNIYECAGGLDECIGGCCKNGMCSDPRNTCVIYSNDINLIYLITGFLTFIIIFTYWTIFLAFGVIFNTKPKTKKTDNIYSKFSSQNFNNKNEVF
jgi:hypothetical protein